MFEVLSRLSKPLPFFSESFAEELIQINEFAGRSTNN